MNMQMSNLGSAAVFCCVFTVLLAATGCDKPKTSENAQQKKAMLVTAAKPVKDAVIERVAVVQGALRTKNSAKIAARVPGAINAVFVDEGAIVTNGTALFQVDRKNIENAARAAKDDLEIAKAKLGEAKAALAKASVDDERMSKLVATRAVTKDTAEKASLQHDIAKAGIASARALVTKAESGVAIAEKNLSDSLVRAPFDGCITMKHKDVGDFVSAGTGVFTMEDPGTYEATFTMNADTYGYVKVGATKVRIRDRAYAITYKAPTVHPVTRTYEIRAAVSRTPQMASGMIVDGEVVLNSSKCLALPSSAIAMRNGKWQAFVVRDGKVAAVPVEKGDEWKGLVEIRNPPTGFADADVVTEGILLLNPGDEVRTK